MRRVRRMCLRYWWAAGGNELSADYALEFKRHVYDALAHKAMTAAVSYCYSLRKAFDLRLLRDEGIHAKQRVKLIVAIWARRSGFRRTA